MTTREEVYGFVRASLNDGVSDDTHLAVPPALADAVAEARKYLREELPAFHDRWAQEYTDGMFAALGASAERTEDALYTYIRDSLIDANFDDDTAEEAAARLASNDAIARRDVADLMEILEKTGYEVRS